MRMLLVIVLLTELLAAVLQSATSTNPTPCEYCLSLKDEVHKYLPFLTRTSNISKCPIDRVSNSFVI